MHAYTHTHILEELWRKNRHPRHPVLPPSLLPASTSLLPLRTRTLSTREEPHADSLYARVKAKSLPFLSPSPPLESPARHFSV